jgi:FMN phosphatase YigB (HAD superfamily)
VGVRAAFFDVGDTLAEGWVPAAQIRALIRQDLVAAYGERAWFDALLEANIEPSDAEHQETNHWYAQWFVTQGIACDVEIDRLRSTFALPLDLVATPVPGGADALRWCKQNGLRVVLVTNTLSRGDTEVLRDWRRIGLADAIDAVVSSHDVGWRKPHPAMFQRALALAGVRPSEAFMVGDNPVSDVRGAQAVGLRAVLRRTRKYDVPLDVRPDAVIDHLDELPAVIRPWL